MTTSEAVPRCPACSAPLPPGTSAAGGCPACLLGIAAGAASAAPSGVSATGSIGDPEHRGAAPPPELRHGLPGLELLEEIGRGGMGVVYRARQTKLDRVVAVKVLATELTRDPRFVDRFAREAAAMARLSHPHILTVHDFGEAGGVFFIVMEYVDGSNLRHVLRSGTLAPAEALAIVAEICAAVQYAHGEGVVHRDLKPENILIDRRGRVRVADFGLAKLAGRADAAGMLTDPSAVIGTPHYMAPEQVERPATVDHRADIYSLGVVFYELLTGELPLGRFEPPSQRVHVDVRLDEVVMRALEKSPERRYQHADDLRTEVERVRTSPGLGSPSGGSSAAPTPPDDAGRVFHLRAGAWAILGTFLHFASTPPLMWLIPGLAVGVLTAAECFLRASGRKDFLHLVPEWIGTAVLRIQFVFIASLFLYFEIGKGREFHTDMLAANADALLFRLPIAGGAVLLAVRERIRERDANRAEASRIDARISAGMYVAYAAMLLIAGLLSAFTVVRPAPGSWDWVTIHAFAQRFGRLIGAAAVAGPIVAAFAVLSGSRVLWVVTAGLSGTASAVCIAYCLGAISDAVATPHPGSGAAFIGALSGYLAIVATVRAVRQRRPKIA